MPYSQFLKRSEFEHEKEFRIIKMLDSPTADYAKNYKRLSFNIDVNTFIESYLLDPRLDEKSYQRIKQSLVNIGADESKISMSELYRFNPITIEID